MIYNLKPNNNALKYLLGNIDWLDVSYTLQSQNKTAYNKILFCLNNNLLNILYKVDSTLPEYTTDQTDSGYNECLSFSASFLDDSMIKINLTQMFVRTFSYYKEKMTTQGNSPRTANYISLYPKMFLDTECTETDIILTHDEKHTLNNSKLLSIEYNTKGGHWLPKQNKTASRSVLLPNYINLFTMKDSFVNYPLQEYELIDKFNGANFHKINLWFDDKSGEDKYSMYAKSFNVVDDSTVIIDFEMYINVDQFQYIVDANDVNIHYHINVTTPCSITNGTCDILLYETSHTFKVNDVVYIKDIYDDETVFIGSIININNNTISVQSLYCKEDKIITEMDKYIVNKIKNLENFSNIQSKNNLLNKMIKNDIFCISDIEFTETDYFAINSLIN